MPFLLMQDFSVQMNTYGQKEEQVTTPNVHISYFNI